MRMLTAYLSSPTAWAISESLYPSILISKIFSVSLSTFFRTSKPFDFQYCLIDHQYFLVLWLLFLESPQHLHL